MSFENANWAALDPSRRERFERAINVAGAGTVLVQNYVNRIIQQLSIRELGALATLVRKPGSGSKAIVNRRTASTMTTSAVWVADTDSVSESTGNYSQAEFTYQTLATRGKVTRKMRARGRTYIDILAEEILQKSGDFDEKLEDGIFTGDSAAEADQIDGILTLVGAVSGQVVAQTTAVAGDDISLSKLDETIDAVKGAGDRRDLVIYGSFKALRKLNAALDSRQRFNNMTEIAAGFRVRTYDDIPLVTTTGLPDDMVWDGSAFTAFSGEVTNPTTGLVVVNRRHLYLEELTKKTLMPLARDDSQYEQFDIFWDGAAVLHNTLGAAILGGISAS